MCQNVSYIFSKKNLLWKSFLYFLEKSFSNFQETELSYISGKVYSELEAYSEHCQTSTMEHFPRLAQKIKKKFLYFFIFLKIKLYSPNIQKVLIFSQRKAFLIFRKRKNPKKSLYFRKRKFLIFWKMETPKKLFIFQKVTFWAQKLKKFTLKKFLIF